MAKRADALKTEYELIRFWNDYCPNLTQVIVYWVDSNLFDENNFTTAYFEYLSDAEKWCELQSNIRKKMNMPYIIYLNSLIKESNFDYKYEEDR